MINFLYSFKLNETDIVDNPFKEDPKNINFSLGGPNFGEGRPENLGKWALAGTSVVVQIRVVKFEREFQPLPPGTKILVMP